MRVLDVWWEQRLTGHLTQDQHGELGFHYAPEWLEDTHAPALSASLPKRAEPFVRRECRPFFGGLLPDEDQRLFAARALGVSRANDFALLDRLGGDVAGALQLLHPGEHPSDPNPDPHPTVLDEAGLIRVLDELPMRPLLAGEDGLRLSLAGAQSKVPVVLVHGAVALPETGQATSHILKPPIQRFANNTENEVFVMRLAAASDLDTAHAEARLVRDRTFLLIERYDRALATDGSMRRIHQEDFCQALGIPPENKYAAEGGPGFKNCFEFLRRISANPAVDVLKLLEAAIFNAIAGNADAHGKNFSILYGDNGPRLAPLYDLLSTVAYPDLAPGFAMKIGNRRMLEDLDEEAWKTFATDAGLGFRLVRQRVAEVCDRVDAQIERAAENLSTPGLNQDAIASFASMIKDRAAWCRRSIGK